jgi:hypothetical protein
MNQYNIIPFNILQTLEACINCTQYRVCDNYEHYLNVCTNFKRYLSMKELKPKVMKPEEKMAIYINTEYLSSNNEIYIECANTEACNFIENNAYLYGRLHVWQKKEIMKCNIPVYNLKISKVFDANEVVNYLLSYNK